MRYYRLWYYSKHTLTFVSMKKDKHLIELGKLIRVKRKEKGFSQEQLALKAKVDRSYIGGIVKRRKKCKFFNSCKNCFMS